MKIVIASELFLLRLGIKTMLNVIGFDAETIEIQSSDELKKFLASPSGKSYVFLDEDITTNKNDIFFDKMIDQKGNVKIMLIGSEKIRQTKCSYISKNDRRKEILQKFQSFLKENEANEKPGCVNSSNILSDRETDVLRFVAQGYSNKEIAEKLYISINTVITHRKNITEKLGVKTIAGLTVFAMMNGIIRPDELA